MSELSKYFKSEIVVMNRSDIRFADYNPRTISEENLKTLKKGIKTFGLVGGIVVNKRTGNTLVQGHQRLSVMDSLQKYNADTHENDYAVRCDLIDVDEKSEKELVILLNNPNAQGEWDYDKLGEMMGSIDYTIAGLTDVDLSMMGISVDVPTDVASVITDIGETITPETFTGGTTAQKNAFDDKGVEYKDSQEYQDKVQHMKDVKAQVKEQMEQRADEASSYVMLSFDNSINMMEFFSIFDIDPNAKIIKGEELLALVQDGFDHEETEE